MAISELVCKECGGSKAVSYKRVNKPIGDTGLEEMFVIPAGPIDGDNFNKVFPRADKAPKGYVPSYEWTTTIFNGKEVPCIRLFMRKVEGAAPATDALSGKSKEELAEIAVMAGVTEAVPAWSRAKLVEAINGAKQMAGA